eukprot:1798207-Lingulodinium_polyedra.AAC.1
MVNEIFMTWLCKCIHVQLTHLRQLKQYSTRYATRVSRLNSDQQEMLDKILSGIRKESLPSLALQPVQPH